MLDSNVDLHSAEAEIGRPCEQLLTPLTRFRLTDPARHFAIDNGAFSGLDVKAFRSLLQRERPNVARCRWVAVPDVVGSARRTLELFTHWRREIPAGFRLALVAQDGLEDLDVPWGSIACLFIGGSTEWKLGPHAVHLIRAAQALGKWVHVGRVNTPDRLRRFDALGVDSFDGSGIARYSWMREAIRDTTAPTAPLFDIGADGGAGLPPDMGITRESAQPTDQ